MDVVEKATKRENWYNNGTSLLCTFELGVGSLMSVLSIFITGPFLFSSPIGLFQKRPLLKNPSLFSWEEQAGLRKFAHVREVPLAPVFEGNYNFVL